MNIDTGVDVLTRLFAKDMASRKVDIRVPDEFLLKPRVKEIIDLVNNQPNHDDKDLETKDAIFHKTIEFLKEFKPRGDLREDEVLQKYLSTSKVVS